jgi:small subunit ribosomal protein S10
VEVLAFIHWKMNATTATANGSGVAARTMTTNAQQRRAVVSVPAFARNASSFCKVNNVIAVRPVQRTSAVVVSAQKATAVNAAAANPTIRIKLKSYWTDLLQDTVDKITEVASTTGATIAGPVPLPTKKRVYTVLRSPHVNKKSREQFEVRTHQRLIDIKDLSTQTIDRLMELDLPAGVDVEVKL